MTRLTIALFFSLVVALVAAGCTAAAPATSEPTTAPSPTAQDAASPLAEPQSPLPVAQSAAGSGVTGEAPQSILDAVLQDAASRTGVPVDELVVVQDQAVEWPDGSLGCPEPGMMYTQALVNGYHILVEAGSETLDYRAVREDFFVLCENADPDAPAATPAS